MLNINEDEYSETHNDVPRFTWAELGSVRIFFYFFFLTLTPRVE